MSDSHETASAASDAARMELEPNTIHEKETGLHLDCPQCGAAVSLVRIIQDGSCPGRLENDESETANETELGDCTAKLSLELVWTA